MRWALHEENINKVEQKKKYQECLEKEFVLNMVVKLEPGTFSAWSLLWTSGV